MRNLPGGHFYFFEIFWDPSPRSEPDSAQWQRGRSCIHRRSCRALWWRRTAPTHQRPARCRLERDLEETTYTSSSSRARTDHQGRRNQARACACNRPGRNQGDQREARCVRAVHDCGLYSIEDMRPINELRTVARWKLGRSLAATERGGAVTATMSIALPSRGRLSQELVQIPQTP
jgi:hypothetical protein